MDEHGNVVSGEVRWFFVSWGMMTDAALMRYDTIRVVVAIIDNEHTPLGVAAFTYDEQGNEHPLRSCRYRGYADRDPTYHLGLGKK